MLSNLLSSAGRRGRSAVFTRYSRGLLGFTGLHVPSDFVRIAQDRVVHAQATMALWRQTPPADRTPNEDVETLDGVSNSLCQIADAAEFIRNVHEEPAWVEGATSAVQSVAQFMNEANVDSTLFERAKGVRDRMQDPSSEHAKVISAMVEAMEHEGVHLDGSRKTALVNLLEKDTTRSFEIVNWGRSTDDQNGTDCGVWFRDSLLAEVFGNGSSFLSPKMLKLFPKRATSEGGSEVQVPLPLCSAMVRSVDNRSIRQTIWEASQLVESRLASQKADLLHELVETRRSLAAIRGYPSWNHYAQRESVMTPLGGPKAVDFFLKSLWSDLEPGLVKETDALLSVHSGSVIEPWDLDYLIQRWKRENGECLSSLQKIQENLTFSRILAGGQTVARKVLNVDMQFDPDGKDTLWHKDAFRLKLARIGNDVNQKESPFAYLYVDPYERSSKLVQSAQYTLQGSKLLRDGSRQRPQTAIVFGLPSDPNVPLPIGTAVTVFHELGHAFHSLLSETTLQHFSGSRGPIDFVEFPSHLFEYFATEPESLREILPRELLNDDVLEEYSTNRTPFGHLEAAQQLTYAMLDQVYYATGSADNLHMHLEGSNPNVQNLLSLMKPNSTASFEHLVHYGGSYYCYLLSRALAAQVWDAAFRNDPWNEDSGERLARFLSNGSVDQSLKAIFSIMPPTGENSPPLVSTKQLIKDLSRCSAIHST